MSQLKQIKISTPKFDETVPSLKKKVLITPFRVGDEKTLLVAAESKNTKQMMNAMKQVVSNCVEGVEIEDLASFDLEYLFLKLRAVSVGESAEIGVKCLECEKTNKIKVDVSEVKVDFDPSHKKEVKVSDDLMFIMKYPDVSKLESTNEVDTMMNVISESVDSVIYGDEAIKITDAEKEDLKDIINGLTTKQFAEVRAFFETMPKVKKEIEFACSECSKQNKVTLEGMADFF